MLSPEDNNERQQIHEHESVSFSAEPDRAPAQDASQQPPSAKPANLVAQEAR
jgi:hypothetical protein